MPSRTKKEPSKKPSSGRKPRVEDYQLVVRWSDEDGCYLASAPALQGCVTHGQTPSQALERGQEAVALWLRDALKHGDPIPKPTHRYSGKLTLRIPATLHQRVAEEAEREGVSINQWIATKLAG